MRSLLILVSICISASAFAQKLEKPAAGSPVRKVLMDALRPTIEKDLKQKVIFKVDILRVYGDWALTNVHPLRPDGSQIEFKKTHYREALEEGMFDGDSTWALLKKAKGKWIVKTFAIGPTDVVWSNWMETPFKAPKALFPPPFGAN